MRRIGAGCRLLGRGPVAEPLACGVIGPGERSSESQKHDAYADRDQERICGHGYSPIVSG